MEMKKCFPENVRKYINKIEEKGFKLIEDSYICKDKLIFNRGNKRISNFFIFVDSERRTVFFSNPVVREGITSRKFNEINDSFFEKTMEIAKSKKEYERFAFLHSHLGYVFNGKSYEPLWGDGVSKDKEWILHTILAHGDLKALTEHNWTQNEHRLNLLKERLDKFNVTFLPGWENTTVINKDRNIDLIQSPHILCYCRNVEAAMWIKENFLYKKLRKDLDVTPIYSGVPLSFWEQIKILDEFRKERKIFYVIAHPSSTLPGIDILDPKCIEEIGAKNVLNIIQNSNGIEMYNSLEKHSDITDELKKIKKFGEYFVNWLKVELRIRGLNDYLSPCMINYLMGLMTSEKGGNTIYGQDDHHLSKDVNEGIRSPYLQGHTKFFSDIKLSSEEFVEGVLDGKIKLTAHSYSEITDKGPKIFPERDERISEKLSNFFMKIEYFANLGLQTIRFYISKYLSKKGIEEISEIKKEIEKAKNFR